MATFAYLNWCRKHDKILTSKCNFLFVTTSQTADRYSTMISIPLQGFKIPLVGRIKNWSRKSSILVNCQWIVINDLFFSWKCFMIGEWRRPRSKTIFFGATSNLKIHPLQFNGISSTRGLCFMDKAKTALLLPSISGHAYNIRVSIWLGEISIISLQARKIFVLSINSIVTSQGSTDMFFKWM